MLEIKPKTNPENHDNITAAQLIIPTRNPSGILPVSANNPTHSPTDTQHFANISNWISSDETPSINPPGSPATVRIVSLRHQSHDPGHRHRFPRMDHT